MALNWVTIVDNKPSPLQGEIFIETVNNATCNLTIPDAPPSTSSFAGGSGGLKKLQAVGTMTLTDRRLIWTNPDADVKSSFKSLTIPLASITSSKFEQPLLAQNYFVITIKPTHGGGLTHGTTLEIRFANTALFNFVNILQKTREKAIFMKRRSMEDDDNLPVYTSPSTSAAGVAPYSDLPPGYDG